MRQLKITHSITNRDIKSLDKYLQDICSEELLTPEEEVQLAQRIKNGDQEALNRLTRSNLRFVVSVAKQYQNQGLSLPDLINEGNVGLIKAAQRFDETRGFKFISYAVWWIRQSILQAIAENSRIVRLPSNQLGALNKLKKEISRLEQELERPPSEEELAELLDIPQDKIKTILGISGRHISIDAPLAADEDVNFVDILPNEDTPSTDDALMQESLSLEIERCLSALTDVERNVIKMYYGIGIPHALSLDEIAMKFNLTRERVRQIKEKGLKRLKTSSKSKGLKAYL
ncbi:MAG: RNA polymerase sigma factor RpoD/SigA [Bacteroidales bacterium]|nr:RNA polymerase sigma factor RpoD/SigA [Bacteroidales bacterium]MBR5776986.1 RNA polymerase sigma factor RpoD/SigA [Bacteroidales bacterium]